MPRWDPASEECGQHRVKSILRKSSCIEHTTLQHVAHPKPLKGISPFRPLSVNSGGGILREFLCKRYIYCSAATKMRRLLYNNGNLQSSTWERALEFLALIGLAIAALLFLPSLLADEKTKLFRRVWSTQLGKSSDYNSKQEFEAVSRLLKLYQIDEGDEKDELQRKIASLMADALTFDMKHPRNFGVKVVEILAFHIRIRFPNLGGSALQ